MTASDGAREAEIRCQQHDADERGAVHSWHYDIKMLLRLLDEERAKVTMLTAMLAPVCSTC